MTLNIDRRTALVAAATAGAVLVTQGCASAQQTPAPGVRYQAQPLPFDPKTIPGLSERILVSHHDNNYVGAVNRLSSIEGEIAKLDITTAPGFMINGLKREELLAMNSMILHEAYFNSLGAGGSPGSKLAAQINKDFGGEGAWRNQFAAMGKALGGGSGWVLLTWSPRAGKLVNQWAFDHTMTVADGQVLLALDMYEHAYHMDYGAKAGAYVDAFMGSVSWSNADRLMSKIA